jgi:hypothetical protein
MRLKELVQELTHRFKAAPGRPLDPDEARLIDEAEQRRRAEMEAEKERVRRLNDDIH